MKLSSLIGHVTELYSDILHSPKPADRLMDQFFRERKYLGSKDRRFISESLYGMLRHKKRIEWSLSLLEQKNTPLYVCVSYLLLDHKMSVENVSGEMDIPLDVLRQIDQRINIEPVLHSEIETFATKFSFQEWMIAEWETNIGKNEIPPLCATLNQQAPITLRVNTIKISRDECRQKLLQEGIETDIAVLSPYGLHLKKRTNVFQLQAFKDGLFEVQDEGSQLLALLVDPKPKSKVIDACAGAGGKALAMASIMNNRGEIFALDVHSFRLEELHKRIRRSGVDSIRTRVIQADETIKEFVESADYVLVDAPCTGTGTIRRNPGMKWSVSQLMVDELQQKQYSILTLNSQYVKPGGRLIYATCSLIQSENQGVVEKFLSLHPQFELVEPSSILSRYQLAHVANKKYFQLLPHQHNTDGFFAAVMRYKN
ncbi:MAG: methyltransferase domain-containing protein [Bacteroidota bacterium]